MITNIMEFSINTAKVQESLSKYKSEIVEIKGMLASDESATLLDELFKSIEIADNAIINFADKISI